VEKINKMVEEKEMRKTEIYGLTLVDLGQENVNKFL
jgi:hypothetical protein